MRFHRAATALALGTALALVLPTAAGACDHDGHSPNPAPEFSVVYLYRKVNPALPASWQNSGRQSLLLVREGLGFVDTLDVGQLPTDVCGSGWAIQEDLVRGLTSEELPTVVDRSTGEGVLGWPPILNARHRELSAYVAVPECVEVLPDVVTPPVVTPPVVIEVSPVVVVPAAPTAPTAPAATAVQAAPSFTG